MVMIQMLQVAAQVLKEHSPTDGDVNEGSPGTGRGSTGPQR